MITYEQHTPPIEIRSRNVIFEKCCPISIFLTNRQHCICIALLHWLGTGIATSLYLQIFAFKHWSLTHTVINNMKHRCIKTQKQKYIHTFTYECLVITIASFYIWVRCWGNPILHTGILICFTFAPENVSGSVADSRRICRRGDPRGELPSYSHPRWDTWLL